MDDAYKHLITIPGFEHLSESDVTFQRQGGLTNLVYRAETPDGVYALRIPGKGTEEIIDRAVEAHNAGVAADVGVSPEVIHADPDSGLMMSRFVDDAVTMTPETFPTTVGAPGRVGAALNKLHTSGETFQFRFELFAMIDDYLSVLDKLGADLPDGYHDVVREAGAVREALDAHPADLAPCHCDPLCENFLDDGTRMWIIDWEYSGMNDPLWDLGDVSVEAGFSPEQDMEMMAAYFGGTPSDAQMGRMVIYKAMCDLLWTLWGLIQHANDNPVEDFWAYATGRFDRCKTLMADAQFNSHVEAVKENR
ncbi:MAG: phosphotransferase family protein [Rhodospirillales bacterium]|jgi:thiamine kinase-like enzyme|nr:phosphotransferase family protein [Rhodospirillales bacterium]MBT4040303.1 phosphotransferase family protein [Rhodospirillales bacterium]MBT4625211.1 phosphotransferase family protein [Rhodospirillales bacterium]MBT5350493.1 phosphotransferase family protein [Rhodospirillales bacterium]MBT5520936.1 phosphotransferase family protein [Rhodospirillales bacterium]